MKQHGIPLVFILLLISTIKQESPFKKLYPLAGTWKMEAGGKTYFENWTIKNTREMAGRSYTVNAADTLILEQVQLITKAGVIYYIPIVTGQNKGQPVSFKLSNATNQQFIFDNPRHDFPQRVIYHLVNSDSLHAWIEGKQNGKEKRSDFYYCRVE